MARKTKREDGPPLNRHGGLREGSGAPPRWLAPINRLQEDIDKIGEQVGSLPRLTRFLFRDVGESIQELVRNAARHEYQLAEHLRLQDHKLARVEDLLERQEARARTKEAQAIERAASARAERDALQAKLDLVSEQNVHLRGVVESMEAHLSRIQHSVRVVPAAIPEEALLTCIGHAVERAVHEKTGLGLRCLPPSIPRRTAAAGEPGPVVNPPA
jgi:hypothetical protein